MATGTSRAPEAVQSPETDPEVQEITPTREEQIRSRAHEIWLERGSPAGSDMEHWLAAEEELRSRLGSEPRASLSH